MHIRIILKFFETYTCSGFAFFLHVSRYVCNQHSCLKKTELYDDLLSSLFYFSCFIFSGTISFSLYSPITPSLLFVLMVFLKPLSNVIEKLLDIYKCVCVCMCYMYFRKFIKFCLTKNIMTF